MDKEILRARACGVCSVRDIPYGVDWQWWFDGKCVHPECHPAYHQKTAELLRHYHALACPECGARMAFVVTVDAGGGTTHVERTGAGGAFDLIPIDWPTKLLWWARAAIFGAAVAVIAIELAAALAAIAHFVFD
jgi:hypothetical protein